MDIYRTLKNFFFDSTIRFGYLERIGVTNMISDEVFLRKKFRIRVGHDLNLDNPLTFNEKLQWLKLHDRKPIYTTMVDKYEVKKYVADLIGEEYIIPTLGVWERFDDIDFDKLPNRFVLKCTHDSGGLAICRDKKSFDKQKAKVKIERSLKNNYYWSGREWPYKNVKPRIIAEELLPLDSTKNNVEYKLFCFNGEVKVVLVCKGEAHSDGTGNRTNDFMTIDFERIPVKILNGHSYPDPEKPKNFELMLELAKKLSDGIPQLRVDFYYVNGRIYIGELTFFHNSGFNAFEPEEYNLKWGEWLTLPERNASKV